MGEQQANESHETTKAYRHTFISYAHEDMALARLLARMLRERSVQVWYDEWELSPRLRGPELFKALSVAIARADAMIVLDTETLRDRGAQKVPGSILANLTAPPEVPLNNAPIIGKEGGSWVQNRSTERILFKEIELDVEGNADSVRERRAVYFKMMRSYGRLGRGLERADWEECHVPYSPRYGTLIGQVVRIEAQRLETALPLLLEELCTPSYPWRRLQQNRALASSEVQEILDRTPSFYDLIGFE